jgi:metal-responsive CopG/Arc/MetJ family transcriptional regulator
MKRTTIMLEPALLAELERLARRSGRPTAHVIRESLERYVADERDREGKPKLPGFVGMAAGGGNVAERADEILREELPDALMREWRP